MAMASAAVDLLLGKIVSFLDDEVSLLGGVRDELEEIKRELLTMKTFVEDAERKGVLSEEQKTWVANVRDVSADVEDCIDEFTYHINKQRKLDSIRKNVLSIHSLPPRIFGRGHRIATKLQKIIKLSKPFQKEANQVSYNVVVFTTPKKCDFSGWDGGSGKTTLVAKTFNVETVKEHFDFCAWITVSQTYTVEDLLRVIMKDLLRAAKEQIPEDLSDMSYSHLVEMLASYLKEKRYVIVLDDVWDINLWRQISAALPDGTHGSRVMLTTRKQDIASFPFGIGSYVHHVQPLNKSEAWQLFSMKAFYSFPNSCCPPELEPIAWDLVEKCEGLPLGIVALGALMSTKSVYPSGGRFTAA
ncbi:hypothetical protein M0R45_009743 [Rubus argutus]|uniref:Uncharacterized protein n=1 Tax=Rubus argutus TaxID=59490 RepID=A0AAW1Y5E5_RUBAR